VTALAIPDLSLVVLIGPSGSGKSSFARRHFRSTEVISSDVCRGLVSDDENDLAATTDAFDVLHYLTAKRLERDRLTVIDATNVQPEARQPLVALARRYHCLPVAIVFDLPERLCLERNRLRPERDFGPHVVRRQHEQMRRSLRYLQREGFRYVSVLHSVEEVDAAVIERQPLYTDRRSEHGPFDIIGDVHGCCAELTALLAALGYEPAETAGEGALSGPVFRHPQGRRAIFLGDLVDRGPRVLATLALVRNMVSAGSAFCLPGNHDSKLLRKLRGRDVQVTHGLQQSLAELEALPAEQRAATGAAIADFLDGLISHYVLDSGKLVVVHAGMKEAMQGRGSREVREFALYGETTGETDEFGLPVRYNWAADYRGKALVIYGHTPVPVPEWLNGTINIDTGCVFGGRLTALRYPERELVSVPAARVYAEPVRPFLPAIMPAAAFSAQQQHDDLLDLEDVTGKRLVATTLLGNVTIPEPRAMTALEVMSHFAIDPRWLIYLPPTMSPPETSSMPGLLEHPAEAFAYYRSQGVAQVVCEVKHMGSRAVVIVCQDEAAAQRRFGLDAGIGICYTRTGRRFFDDAALEAVLLAKVQTGLAQANLWAELATDWVCLDCELLPWSAKAQDLLRRQYAPVGTAARVVLAQAVDALAQAAQRGAEVTALLQRYSDRADMASRYIDAYRRYCWPVESLADLKLAPFHLLASEGAVHTDKDHLWHLQTLERLCQADATLFLSTAYQAVDVTDTASQELGIGWWEALTASGGEGMVVKPLQIHQSRRQAAPGAAGREVPGTGVPAPHLRSRIQRARASGAPAFPCAGGQAVTGPPRVRAGCGSAGALRASGAAAPGPRVRLRRAGAGERAGGPAAVMPGMRLYS
jgi:protein phosphatase